MSFPWRAERRLGAHVPDQVAAAPHFARLIRPKVASPRGPGASRAYVDLRPQAIIEGLVSMQAAMVARQADQGCLVREQPAQHS